MPILPTDQTVEQLQEELIRKMSPGRRLEVALSLYRTAWQFKASALRQQHPDWSEMRVQSSVRRVFLTGHAGS